MRLRAWAGARCLLVVLVLLTVLHVKADQDQSKERRYYIAAVEIDWNYSGNDTHRLGPTYKKVVFREYEKDFRQAKTHPSWLGLLGPTLRAEEGETLVVTFRNMATGPLSLHPHGVAYGKQSEGANYFDNTSQREKEDDMVQPNSEHVYYWKVTSDVSPQPRDPTCLTYTYVSHQNVVEDYNSGLIGTLLICKSGSLDESGRQVGVSQEYVFLFGVFDEKESKYKPTGHASDNHVKYSINGYTEGSLPDVSVCAHASVGLHLLGMSSEPEVFSVHMNGQVLQQTGHKVSSVGLISGSSTTASMVALHTGRWLLSSLTIKHMEAGMHGFVDVKKCAGFNAPLRRMTIEQKRHSREWKYYIAAEEIIWDYTPDMHSHIDEDFKFQYLRQSSTRIGGKYKKAVYTLYKNESFSERSENKQRKNELGILGPVIRAQIRDVIKIVFKNMASRPYSIYPHGLTIEKSEEGVNYPAGGNQSHGVQPGETHTYVWRVVEEDEPLDSDSRCLTRLYHSAVDTPRDIASGLIGPILICKSMSLNVRNVQLKADKEQHAMMAVFDENKSWYLDDNIHQYCDRSKVNRADPDFYKSNVMHTINGYAFESGPLLGFCNGEVATWHVSSVGAQDYIQTATFYGHTFELHERTEDFLSLYPMTGETITMNMDNIGVWLLASLNSHGTTKGMRVKFQDVECYRDNQYEYSDYDNEAHKEFTVWNPVSLDDIKKEEEKPKPEKEKPVEKDIYTEIYADLLGVRSLKNQSRSSGVEELDLSFLDYDAIDVLDGDTSTTLNFSISKPNAENEILFSNWTEVDGINVTAVNLLSLSISENTTHMQSNSTPSMFGSSSENTTVFNSLNISLKNGSITTNSSASVVVLNVTVSDTRNATVHNAAELSKVGNVASEITNLTVKLKETTNLTVTLRGNSTSISEAERMNITPTGDSQTSVGTILVEDSEEKLTRGDVFSYSEPLSTSSTNNLQSTPEGNATSLSHSAQTSAENDTATNQVNASTDGTNHSPSIPAADVGEVNTSSINRCNLTILEVEVESTGNKTSDNDSLTSAAEPEYGREMNSSELQTHPANSSHENVTHVLLKTGPLENVTGNISRSNSSGEISWESRQNLTALLGELNLTSSAQGFSNETMVSGNLSNSSETVRKISLERSRQNLTALLGELNLTSSAEGFSNETVVSGNLSNSSETVRKISLDSRMDVTALLGELNLTSSAEGFSNETVVSGNLSNSSETVRKIILERSRQNLTALLGELNLTASAEGFSNETMVSDNLSNSSEAVRKIRWDSRMDVTALLGELNLTSSAESFSNETVVSGNLSNSNETVRKISLERSRQNLTALLGELKLTSSAEGFSNETMVSDNLSVSSEAVRKIILESRQNLTSSAEGFSNETVVSGNLSNSNETVRKINLESRQNLAALLGELNLTSSAESFSNETVVSGNLSNSNETVGRISSEELGPSDSSEEVIIYLKENNTGGIKTTSFKTQGYNWTYEGTHQVVPMEIPDYMMKYLGKKTPLATPKKKVKKLNLRQRPQKGQGMKTKKRKEYKPQARSGLPFSPRGFNPEMTPRGSRPHPPHPDSEELINMPVVIGVPRPEFSDYELYVPGDEPRRLELDEHDVKADEYEYVIYKDPYSSHEDIKNLNLDETTKYYLKFSGPNVKTYFIAAEEAEWDYAGYGQRRQDKWQQNSRETKFTKVVFRSYMDSSFSTPEIRGELDEHLGILGPVIKAEVGQSIMVVFRNKASRPYSLHPNGVSYTKQTEGLSYDDDSKYWYKYDNEVQPNTTFTYMWKVNSMVGPTPDESHCRTWAYYSGVNPERDIHSGLIGPLLVCREGTLDKKLSDMREFTLLFMTFDESQSWYYEKNHEMIQRKTKKRVMPPNFKESLKFHSINGIIYNLKGLRMYTNQLACWHLINMGSPKDYQSVHFHGQTFLHKKTTSYRQAVYPLLPGSFATLEMYPSKPGLWQLETEVGFNQQKGMQTLFLVLDNDCYRPLGLQAGSVKDNQITAVNTRGSWKPHLARLNNQGQCNAWSTEQNNSWIQVDFQRPVVISQVATQGAKQRLYSQFVVKYLISYSSDRRNWIFYKGDSRDLRKVFAGNQEAHEENKNTFFPPVIGRFIRLHPIHWYNKATVRMEFYGCELDGCSVPLGMESGLIEDRRITASSTASSWYSGPWKPSLARLNRQGTINAWQAKYNDMNQWLQVELPQIKKITGIITQGAKSLGKEMYVMSYTLQYSDNGIHWNQYTDDEDLAFKTFPGNTDNNGHVKNYIYPPIFSRFIRIIPRSWMVSLTMRIELLGCDFE